MIDLRTLVVVSLLASSSAAAQVAVALTLPDPNPTHRDIAAGVVERVAERWELLSPALPGNAVALCVGEVTCLQQLADEHGATHLLVVGVAGLGPREAALSVQLFDDVGTALINDSVVVEGSDPREEGRGLVARLLLLSPVMPARVARPVRNAGARDGVLGAGLVGAGVVVGAGSWVGASLLADSAPDAAVVAAIAGVSAGVVLAAVGTVLVVVDE